ncbi:hypothetical protein ASC61_02635 [Aeromicrobium sp. Root344]|uniref:choice-of-anchor P family protein n=1 Tax=Aeromicrobium sp. Root344 TaxID=1736521 RepID=UPI00070020CE|nr:choice-of-anchor P family protein [Aeromicrobium sp. Root344]KQV73991.1 hypothetical protein ASC61_02635 [Aeromicrobium sp. Root344]
MSRRPIALLASAATLAAVALAALPAQGAEPDPNTPYAYYGAAGGTYVRVLGSTVISDPTAASSISGTTYPNQQSNNVASAEVGTLVRAGAVTSSVDVTKVGTTVTETAKAQTANVSLLNGLIKVNALKTVTHATRTGTVLAGDSDTELVGVAIKGKNIPLDVDNNFGVDIAGIASIILNEKKVEVVGGKITVTGSALKVKLLKAYEGSPIGTTITVNPTTASLSPSQSTATPVGGFAYGTYAKVNVGTSIKVISGTSALAATPQGSTFGYDIYNRTAQLNVPLVLQVGAIQSVANSISGASTADVTHSNETAGVNVLNGLIRADAIKVSARSQKFSPGVRTNTAKTELVNLIIGGKKIALDPAVNTTTTIPKIVKVVINEQTIDAWSSKVVGLHVTLLSPRSGLTTGAEIYVAVAASVTY